MRACAALLLFALAAPAGEEGELERLVAALGDRSCLRREAAHEELLRMGQEILPRLREFDSPDPEVRRRLRAILRGAQQLRLELSLPPGPLAIGSALRMRAELRNDTDESYLVPLSETPFRGAGSLSPFQIAVDGKLVRLTPDQVQVVSTEEPWIHLLPGASLAVELTVPADELPMRRPGRFKLEAAFETGKLLRRYSPDEPADDLQQETIAVRVEAVAAEVEASGRTAAALEKALAAGDAGALAELTLREDDAVLPLLRAHLLDPRVRLPAVKRLCGAGRPEDLQAILDATGDADLEVRIAAVLGLGGFADKKARRRLALIARSDDFGLIGPAVKALTRHRHAMTVQTFLDLLKHNYRDGPWLRDIHDALFEWTGRYVNTTRRSEIEAFESWWIANQERWSAEGR